MVIPGHLRVDVYNSGGLDPVSGWHPFGPGVYENLTANQWNDIIASFNIVRTKTWDQFKVDCCKGVGDATLCKQFWGPTNTDGSCDSMILNYCATTPDAQTCSCINSQLPAPSCFDLSCTTKGGYQTTQMKARAQNCGNMTYVDCRMLENQINLGNGDVNKISFTQYCGNSTSDPGSDPTVPTNDGTPSVFWEKVGTFFKNNQTTLIIGGVTAALLLAVALLLPKKKPKTGVTSEQKTIAAAAEPKLDNIAESATA